MRDDRPFVGADPPAAVFSTRQIVAVSSIWRAMPDCAGRAYAGFSKLYEANRKGGLIIEAAC